jgi:hypothetical protein
MKGLKKLTLASAIAVAPFASQALEALDDATMGDVTGQAGVTIDISIEGAGITVGEITYTDTPTLDTSVDPAVSVADVDTTGDGNPDAHSGGSVILQDLNISGITNLTQTIDVLEDGDLYMTTTGVDGVSITLGDNAADAAVNDRSAVQISGSAGTAELVNDIAITMDLGASTTRIHNMANGDTLGTAAGVVGANADNWAPVAIEAVASFEITNMNANIFGYTESDAARKTAGDIAANDGDNTTSWADYATVDAGTGEVSLTAGAAATDIGGGVTGAQAAAARANGGAIGIRGLSFSNPAAADGNVTVEQVIWADAGGVSIQVGQIQGTLAIDAIEIGGASIGSVSVSGINLAGLTQTIRGH